MDLYNNKTSSFRVNLSKAIKLDVEKYEVGLAELQFPVTWYNVREGKNVIKLIETISVQPSQYFDNSKPKPHIKSTSKDVKIPAGYYHDVGDIIRELHKVESKVKFEFQNLPQKTSITLPKNMVLDWNGSDIADCLGFDPAKQIKNSSSLSENISSTQNCYKNIYVYTDIIQNQYVGDVQVPLLRIVPVNKSYGEMCCIRFDKPFFVPLNRNFVDCIKIDLRDDRGELISFMSGKSSATLLFKRKVAKFFD